MGGKENMIKSVMMLKDFRTLRKGEVFEFREGVNLLVGEQGSGKSSLLSLLMGKYNSEKYLKSTTTDGKAVSTRSFDFERDNPRISRRVDSMLELACIMSSHGQYVHKMILEIEDGDQFRDFTILMDEPDMALSIRSCHSVVKAFKKAVENGCQLILSIHNPIIISSFEEVFSMEHRKWMASSDFIKSHSIQN